MLFSRFEGSDVLESGTTAKLEEGRRYVVVRNRSRGAVHCFTFTCGTGMLCDVVGVFVTFVRLYGEM